ncbi:MAG TPA: hypothetical protein VII28_04300 [Puia sp.]
MDYLKCFQRAIFNSVISPAPEMRLISSSFLLMAIAVVVAELADFLEDKASGG